jgi:hypothetical protein
MKSLLALFLIVLVCAAATNATAAINSNGKYSIYVAGPHDSKANTCDYVKEYCTQGSVEIINQDGGRYDLYVIATDVNGLAGIRYGLRCEMTIGTPPYFYGWTGCSDFEIPSAGWPACGENNSEAWSSEQPGLNVTVGILDTYVYPGTIAKIGTWIDSRVGYAEMCDGSEPYPLCAKRFTYQYTAFGYVGVNRLGFNPCGAGCPTEAVTWGAVKSLYR